MAVIWLDPSECRETSRLPARVIESGIELPGLEATTGADMLLSPLSAPKLTRVDMEIEPLRVALQKHVDAGLLVQRKSGRDFTMSIPSLSSILFRMQQWTARPWLLVVAGLKCSAAGECIVDGHASGFTYAAVEGALCWWQLRGGYVSIISRDSLIAVWINGWLERLQRLQQEPERVLIRAPQQPLTQGVAWASTLATFPLVGHDKALAIAKHCGSLARSLEWLSDPVGEIEGVGAETCRRAKQWLGLDNDLMLQVTGRETTEETTE